MKVQAGLYGTMRCARSGTGKLALGRAVRCGQHRAVGDKDMRNRQCEAVMHGWNMQVERAATFACPNRASFGNAAEGRVRFCSLHKRLDDVNLNIKRKCSAQGCCRYPSFCGPASHHPTFCAQHRPDGFVHATNLPKSRPNLLPTDRSRLW